jgi:predicted RNA methylase
MAESEYFLNYGDLAVHELMLRDNSRVAAYKNYFEANDSVRNKVVLDVGAGTGILSLLAARAGAKQVHCE